MRLRTRCTAATSLLLGVMLAIGGVPGTATADTGPAPLRQAHAHNDYEHPRPLHDALDHGFTSVEADIWLVDGRLLVAHDLADVDPSRTLRSLYLDPLDEVAKKNGGSVYPGDRGPFQLLVDVKSEAEVTYAALDKELKRYPKLVTHWRHGREKTRAVTAVVSGNRAFDLMARQKVRYAGYDGRLSDLASDAPASLMPLVSDNWTTHFAWNGDGPIPADQREKLRTIVDTAHAKGYRLRFWETPDTAGPARTAVWTELRDAGVDHLNTDDLAGLQDFLRQDSSRLGAGP
ncbi:MAG: hypothetical protein GEV10_13155 [Streptosporangiales bacterium]|nr:hypothetical protein [Streptosporangiales bacterium]